MTQTYASTRTEQVLLRKREAAACLTVSLRTLDRLIASGVLPVVRLGGSVRLRPEDLRELIERSREGVKGGP